MDVNQRLNGINPLAYIGVNAYEPTNFVAFNRDPTQNDLKNFELGTWWENLTNYNLWYLAAQSSGVATWLLVSGSTGSLVTLTANSGGAVSPLLGNINVVGDAIGITITGNPGTHTLTASLIGGGIAAQSFPTDSGTATPNASGVLIIRTNQASVNAGATVRFTGSTNVVQLNVTDASSNTLLGLAAGNTSISGALQNSGFGAAALTALTSGDSNSAFGYQSLLLCTTSDFNTAIGSRSLNLLTTSAGSNTAVGYASGFALSTGSDNSLFGASAGSNYTTTGYNIAIGSQNLGLAGEIGMVRIGVPSSTGSTNTNNTFVGYGSGNSTYTLASAVNNTFIGAYAGVPITTGNSNTCLGQAAGAVLTTGSDNTLIGSNSGAASFVSGISTGGQNTAVGNDTLWQISSGSRNSVFGNGAGASLTLANSDNIMINASGTAGDNNTLRIGQATGSGNYQLNKSFVQGIYGITPGVALPLPVVIDSAGQLGTGSGGSANYSFNAIVSADVVNATGNGANYTVIFDTEIYDTGSNFNNATGIFTAPVAGTYQFNTEIGVKNISAAMDTGLIRLDVGGTGPSVGQWGLFRNNATATQSGVAGIWRCCGSVSFYMNAGDSAKVVVVLESGAGNTATVMGAALGAGFGPSWFSGYKVA